MSYEPTDDATVEELQNAMENNDIVTNDELGALHPDLNMSQIGMKLDMDEAQLKAANPHVPDEPRYAARKGMKTYHSGPKGVIADHAEAKLKMRAHRIQDKSKRDKKVYMNLDDLGINKKIQPFSIKYNKNNNNNNNENKRDDGDSDSDLDSDDSDDEAMQIYKQQKLELLEKYRPKYGNCMEVTALTFDEKVENAPKNVWVVMHVYQDYMERCEHMNRSLAQLAKAYPHVCFLRARSDRIALDGYAEIGMPTLIVFKNGDQLQNHIAMQTLVKTPFTAAIIEEFLIEQKVLVQSVDMIEKPTEKTRGSFLERHSKQAHKPLKSSNNVDDNDSGSELDIE